MNNQNSCKKSEEAEGTKKWEKIRKGRIWWNKRSSFERIILAVCLVLFIVSVCLVIVNVLIQGRLKSAELIAGKCYKKECVLAASLILEKMDERVNPCEDFYQFACGNFLKTNAVPDDHHTASILQMMHDEMYVDIKKLVQKPMSSNDSEAVVKVKKFYASCMNTSNIEEKSIRDLLTEADVGDWPLLEGADWHSYGRTFEWRLSRLLLYNSEPFISFHIMSEANFGDSENTSAMVMSLYVGSPFLSRSYYLNESNEEYVGIIEAYKNLLNETVRLLKAPENTVDQDVKDIIDFEVEFANITWKTPEKNETNSDTNSTQDEDRKKLNFTELQDLIPEINWREVLGYVFDKAGVSLFDVTFSIGCEACFHSLGTLISSTPPRTIANYLTWRFVIKYMRFLDAKFRLLFGDFRKKVPGLSHDRLYNARWKECISIANENFGEALASMYVKEMFDDRQEEELNSFIEYVRNALVTGMKNQEWLDPETQSSCEEKFKEGKIRLGFNKKILDNEQLDATYQEIETSEYDFFYNILMLHQRMVKKQFSKFNESMDKDPYLLHPLTVNAFFDVHGNTAVFPVGILRKPIFVPGIPSYLSFGTIGVIIGHEFTHGFASNGWRPSKSINRTDWPEETFEKFKERAMCFAEQYSALPIPETETNVDGNSTLDDNLCDNSGLKQAYKASKTFERDHGKEPGLLGIDYSNIQVYFIRYAQLWCEVVSKEGYEKYKMDSHSPGQYRSNIPLMNSYEFSETFNCPLGSPMNPEKKCKIWD